MALTDWSSSGGLSEKIVKSFCRLHQLNSSPESHLVQRQREQHLRTSWRILKGSRKYLRAALRTGAESDIPPASCRHIQRCDGCSVHTTGRFPAHSGSWEMIVLILSVWSTL